MPRLARYAATLSYTGRQAFFFTELVPMTKSKLTGVGLNARGGLRKMQNKLRPHCTVGSDKKLVERTEPAEQVVQKLPELNMIQTFN